MNALRLSASCPCEACARLAGVITVRLREDDWTVRRPAITTVRDAGDAQRPTRPGVIEQR